MVLADLMSRTEPVSLPSSSLMQAYSMPIAQMISQQQQTIMRQRAEIARLKSEVLPLYHPLLTAHHHKYIQCRQLARCLAGGCMVKNPWALSKLYATALCWTKDIS